MTRPPPSYTENFDMDDVLLRPSMRRAKHRNAEDNFQRQVRSLVQKKTQAAYRNGQQKRTLRNIGAKNGVAPLPHAFSQRVVVQARVVRHNKDSRQQLQKHLQYVQRDGAGKEQAAGMLYGTHLTQDLSSEAVQGYVQGFVEKCAEDRHSFRFIVSLEHARELDLALYTRNLMAEMEKDLETPLEWVAVDHYNTDNPHTHIMVRGRDGEGKDLVIDPQYISQGMRHQAMYLATLELGPRTALDMQRAIMSDVGKERFTPLDRMLLQRCDTNGMADLRYDAPSPGAAFRKKQLQGRVQHLECMGLVKRLDRSGFLWGVSPSLEQELKAMGTHGDIIKTMHRAMRGDAQYYRIFNGDTAPGVIQGRVVEKGLIHELYDREYAIIEATDGHAYYVALGNQDRTASITQGCTISVTARDTAQQKERVVVEIIEGRKTGREHG